MTEQKQSIKISKELKKYLTDRGTKADSYEAIIWRLIGQKKIPKLNKGKKKNGE